MLRTENADLKEALESVGAIVNSVIGRALSVDPALIAGPGRASKGGRQTDDIRN